MRRTQADQVRFENSFIPEPNSGCWLWLGKVDAWGYGRLTKKRVRATHVSLAYAGKTLPTGMIACHRCDNPSCVNPDHLFPGTHGDNARDRARKGRSAKRKPSTQGILHRFAKLTEADVILMRAMRSEGMTFGQIAQIFKNSRGACSDICSGKSWSHVPLKAERSPRTEDMFGALA